MAVLDFSTDKADNVGNQRVAEADIKALVDQNSLGTRDKDGLIQYLDGGCYQKTNRQRISNFSLHLAPVVHVTSL